MGKKPLTKKQRILEHEQFSRYPAREVIRCILHHDDAECLWSYLNFTPTEKLGDVKNEAARLVLHKFYSVECAVLLIHMPPGSGGAFSAQWELLCKGQVESSAGASLFSMYRSLLKHEDLFSIFPSIPKEAVRHWFRIAHEAGNLSCLNLILETRSRDLMYNIEEILMATEHFPLAFQPPDEIMALYANNAYLLSRVEGPVSRGRARIKQLRAYVDAMRGIENARVLRRLIEEFTFLSFQCVDEISDPEEIANLRWVAAAYAGAAIRGIFINF